MVTFAPPHLPPHILEELSKLSQQQLIALLVEVTSLLNPQLLE